MFQTARVVIVDGYLIEPRDASPFAHDFEFSYVESIRVRLNEEDGNPSVLNYVGPASLMGSVISIGDLAYDANLRTLYRSDEVDFEHFDIARSAISAAYNGKVKLPKELSGNHNAQEAFNAARRAMKAEKKRFVHH